MPRFTPLPILAALLSGCATMPHLGPAPEVRPAASLESQATLRATDAAWPADDWWAGYGDPALESLIAEALASSPDIAAAAARVRTADGLAQQAGAALLPSLTADGFAGGNKQSKSLGIPPQFIPDGIQETGRVTGTFSFDLDLWGQNRANLAAATSEAEAARVDAAQTALMLSTGVASAYADLAQYFAQRDVAVEALKVRQATLDLTAQRVAVGVDTRGSLKQAESRVPAARADIQALDEAIALTRNRLAALLGKGPDRGLTIARPRLTEVATGFPADAGIELVGRRPDIVAARLRSEAASKRIKAAKADFLPNLSLTAVVGLQSLGFDQLFKGASSYGTGGAAISLPIFDGGRIAGRYRQARGGYDESVARYDSTLITALREVADAVASRNAADSRLAEQQASLAAAEEAAHIARLRYEGGLSNQLPVLVADDTMLAARRAVSDLQSRRLSLDIALIRALGGGYRQTPAKTGSH